MRRNLMKKIKTFLFSLVPTLLGFGIQFSVMFYFMILSAIIMFAVVPSLTGQYTSYYDVMNLFMDTGFNTLIMIVFSVICTVTFGIWYYRSCGGNYRLNLKKEFHPLQLAGILIMVPGTQFATSILISVISTVVPKWYEDYLALIENAGVTEASLLMLLYSVCLAPFSEELLFRGVTMRIARRAFPFWVANIIQAVLFGVFHMNMLQGCYAFALGLILGYICEYGGSIYYSIFFHFLFNLWGMTSEWLNSINEVILGLIILLGAVILFPLGTALFHTGTKQKKTQTI